MRLTLNAGGPQQSSLLSGEEERRLAMKKLRNKLTRIMRCYAYWNKQSSGRATHECGGAECSGGDGGCSASSGDGCHGDGECGGDGE